MDIASNPPVAMDPIIQPDPVPPDTESTNSFLVRLLRWDKDLDAAVCSIGEQDGTRGRSVSPAIVELPRLAACSKPHVVGLKVIKFGLRTGITRGIIDGTDGVEFSIVIDSEFPPSQGMLSGPGDSGSLWLDRQTFTAVGLHFTSVMSPEIRAWGRSMTAVCEKLKIFVLDTIAISPAFIGGSCRVLARTRPWLHAT